MIPLYLFLLGSYFYYAQSKYFAVHLFRPVTLPAWILPLIFITGLVMNILFQGWVSGILLTLVSVLLAVMLVQFTAVLGKKYFLGLVILIHTLVIINILN